MGLVSASIRKLYSQTNMAEVDRVLTHVQEAARDSQAKMVAGGIMDGRLLEGVSLSTTASAVAHGLGRRPRGWLVVDNDSGVTVYRTEWDSRTMTLTASATCTASIWVF